MKADILHQDGTVCCHEGPYMKSDSSGKNILCLEGIVVTHIRFNGNVMTLEESAIMFMKMTKIFNESMQPLIVAFTKMASQVGSALNGIQAIALDTAISKDKDIHVH